MSHLLAYEEARTEKQKALAALHVATKKNSKSASWSWAEWAAEHAENCGIEDAESYLGDGRYPEVGKLKDALLKLT